jgi:hypothetical protein
MSRFGVRVAFLYFALFYGPSQLLGWIPGMANVLSWWRDLWMPAAIRIDTHVLHYPYPMTGNIATGSALALLYLTVAAGLAAVWAFLDRGRDERLAAWLRVFLRFLLAPSMIHYGMIKLIPTQMIAPPPPGILGRPVAEVMPNHLLWWTIGASPAYESFLGFAEIAGGVLLLVPRTVLLGALLTAGNMLVVFMMNMCYDVPVKFGSLHYFLMAAVIVLLDGKRLSDLFLRNRRVEAAPAAPLTPYRPVNLAVHLFVGLFGLYAIGSNLITAVDRWHYIHPPPNPPMLGMWEVASFRADGREVPATDPKRWKWVIVQRTGRVNIELVSGAFRKLPPAEDFRYDGKVAVYDGTFEGRRLHVILRRAPLTRYGLTWIAR